jgi:hypothetical protein
MLPGALRTVCPAAYIAVICAGSFWSYNALNALHLVMK